jgi:hypothetical protein
MDTVVEIATCQVCGRQIKAKTGLIAHHGYKRPYEGWQTASCEGARYVPYEVSCERLIEVTTWVEKFIQDQELFLADLLTTPPQTITVFEKWGSYGKGEEVTYERPSDFKQDGYQYCIPRTYDSAYGNRKFSLQTNIKAAKADFSIMQRRIQEWKPAIQATQKG